MTPSPDDAALLHSYANSRDPSAFAELARRYAGMTLSIARRITRSDHDAEDIAQSAFLELAKAAPSIRSVPGFLHRAATTRALNFVRDEKTRRAYESQPKAKSAMESPDLTVQQLLPIVDAAINQLPDDLRIPLILHYQKSLSQSEIAASLKLSQPTVSRRLESAIMQLRLKLSKMGEGAAMAGAAVGVGGGLSAAMTTSALTQTAALPPPVALLSAVNKIGLAGITKSAAVASTGYFAKLLVAFFITAGAIVAVAYLFGNRAAGPAVVKPQVELSGSSSSSSSSAGGGDVVAVDGILLSINALPRFAVWRTTFPFASAAALSPDGRYVLAASNLHVGNNPAGNDAASSLVLYDAATQQPLQIFRGHRRYITAVAFSPDGNFIASASRDNTVRIWDAATGDELHRFEVKNTWFTAVAFSPDGREILAGGHGGMEGGQRGSDSDLFLWDVETEKTVVAFEPNHSSLVNGVAFSPNGKMVAIGTNGSEGNVFDVQTGKEVLRVSDGGDIRAVAFSPDSSKLATGGDAEVVSIWDLNGRGERFADGMESPALAAKLEGHDDAIYAVVFTSDGGRVISAGGKDNLNGRSTGDVRVWEVSTRNQLACSRLAQNAIHALSLNSGSTRAVAASFDGSVSLYDLTRFEAPVDTDQPRKNLPVTLRTFSGFRESVQTISFSVDGRDLFAVGDDSSISLWNVADGSVIRHCDFSGCFAGAFVPPNGMVGFAATDLMMARTDSASPVESYHVLEPGTHRDEITSSNLPVFGNGTRALLLGQKRIIIWNLVTHKIERQIDTPERVRYALVSPDEKIILTAQRDAAVRIYDTGSGELIHEFKTQKGECYPLLFAPDGKSFFRTENYGRKIFRCDIETGEILQQFIGHKNNISALAITSDAKTLISSAYDKTVRLWDVDSATQIEQYDTRRLTVGCLAISPDNKTVASDNPDGTISLWALR